MSPDQGPPPPSQGHGHLPLHQGYGHLPAIPGGVSGPPPSPYAPPYQGGSPYPGYPPQPPYGYGQPYPAALDKSTPIVMYILYLVAFVFAPTAIAGLIVAYANRGSGGPITDSHYAYGIRTFWMGLLYSAGAWTVFALLLGGAVASGGDTAAGLGLFAGGAVVLAQVAWWIVRCIRGLVFLGRGAPVPDPTTWLW